LSGERIHLLNLGGTRHTSESDRGDIAAVEVIRGSNVEQIPGLMTWNTLLLNWVGPQGTIRPRQLSELLAIEDDEQGRQLFGGKAVIIGQRD
ncbi:MAG: hypothetical protein GTN78_23845, partial [Gemmatimonadales bacterium]|nr:hypothetical protein [Gemmatimonadales bacterium]